SERNQSSLSSDAYASTPAPKPAARMCIVRGRDWLAVVQGSGCIALDRVELDDLAHPPRHWGIEPAFVFEITLHRLGHQLRHRPPAFAAQPVEDRDQVLGDLWA